MSFTYTQPWAATLDYVRFLVGDTQSATAVFDDEELTSLLAEWGGDARMAAAEALDALAAKYARGAIKYAVTGFSMDRTKLVDALRMQATALREQAQAQPFEFESILEHFVDSSGLDWSNYSNTSPESA